MANKLLALKKDVFDISKVTVVGSPTITSDGVASGFSGNDYVVIQNIFTSSSINLLEFEFEFIPSNENEHYLQFRTLDNTNQIVISKGNGNLSGFTTFNGTTYNYFSMNISLESDNKYVLHYKQTIDTIYITVTNKTTGQLQTGNIAGAFPLLNTNTICYIGKSIFGDYAKKSIDLTQFKIYVDNELVYTPTKPTYLIERRKEGYDSSKFTVVGSPTITEYGVASGFVTSNSYLSKSLNLQNISNLEVITCVSCSELTNTYQYLFSLRESSSVLICEANINSSGALVFAAKGVTTLTVSSNITKNQKYFLKYQFNEGIITLSYSLNGENWIVGRTANVDYTSVNAVTWWLGGAVGGIYAATNCKLYLPNYSITVDGKEVFTGAKEQFYMLRR